jgi:hypothetical protein
LAFFNANDALKKALLAPPTSDLQWNYSGSFKPEMFYGKNISLLNNCNPEDRIWYLKHTLDLTIALAYGMKSYDSAVADLKISWRNKAIWGEPYSIAWTTLDTTKFLDYVIPPHNHAIPRMFNWMREVWLRFDITKTLGIFCTNQHTFMAGVFPFQLGRGIALGDAYATGPDPLGFYTDSIVDQYAPGLKFSGDIVTKKLAYDLYIAILNNRSDDLRWTGERIRAQEIGRLDIPARGFGVVNYLVAGRLQWQAFDATKLGKLSFEPYWLFNSDPEQRIIFLGDASSKLATLGLAGEYVGDVLECGFDTAFNVGHQRVKAIDRNIVQAENRNGCFALVNSHVRVDSPTGPKVLFVAGDDTKPGTAQNLITQQRLNERIGENMEVENGKCIGMAKVPTCCCDKPTEVTLYNANNRYRDGYLNSYEGWMFVADLAVWLYKKDLKLAATAGIASGDDDPNLETKDGNYKGFIGLQEIYSGKRVRSAFVLGGSGKIRRPFNLPIGNQAPRQFAINVSRFTDLVFGGVGLNWKPTDFEKTFAFNPNVLVYWEEMPTKCFDITTKQDVPRSRASTYLGLETNVFVDYYMLRDLRFYFVTSFFFPGRHFTDIRGKPIDEFQRRRLDRLDRTGFEQSGIPNIGDNIAYTFNAGVEFKF